MLWSLSHIMSFWRLQMNVRTLALALGFATVSLLGSNIVLAETSAIKPAALTNVTAENSTKSEHVAKHKDLEKHEKALHEKKEGSEAGEAKEGK
jgi:hypothetical protein